MKFGMSISIICEIVSTTTACVLNTVLSRFQNHCRVLAALVGGVLGMIVWPGNPAALTSLNENNLQVLAGSNL
jgi:hypothetical protein